MTLKLLDAFAGIGGGHLGVKLACEECGIDFECVGAIEKDKHATITYQDNFKDCVMFNDITSIDIDKLPDHDMLIGGFPCQPFSIARKNNEKTAGLNADGGDSRAFLYKYLCKILNSKQPKYFIFENVKGLLKERVDGEVNLFIDTVVNDFKNCGYNVVYKVLNSKDFNAPQNRERVYFVGYRSDIGIPNLDISHSIDKTYIIDVLETKVDDYYYLKNLWEKIPNHKLKDKYANRYEAILAAYNSGRWCEPTQKQHKIVQTARVEKDTPSEYSRQRDRVYSAMGLSPTLLCTSAVSISVDGDMRQLTPREYARIQCFPDSFKISNNRIQCYKQFGNAMCVNVIKSICANILKEYNE